MVEDYKIRRQKVLEKYVGNKKITSEVIYEDGSKVITYGELNFDKLMKLLLNCKYITD
ncbi:hypothetical protein [Schinkia azotoformans]|uniref:hypothetical protein n=1 Tax=Schinkia azotoformans TaxID=1454 RepID=UPI002DBF5E30|nr:hypothetical protein [Schinkia azotoformans]MEC1780092.1 hypothetical protein [Schinkia azotoformans]MED4330829.1 hypothetical protein [Schinkia azotoformans]